MCLPASVDHKQNVDGILSGSLMKALSCVIDLKDAKITFTGNKAPNSRSKMLEER